MKLKDVNAMKNRIKEPRREKLITQENCREYKHYKTIYRSA